MPGETSVIFDLDGTLLDSDSTTAWMMARIRRSWWRLVAALAAAPIALALMSVSATRRIGASAVLWIATVGLDRAALQKSFDAFAAEVAVGRSPVGWRLQGLEVLRRHLVAGDRVVIATAAPTWRAQALTMHIHLSIPIIGSSLATLGGGWIGTVHSRHEKKCTLLAAAGHGKPWGTVYSDSADDAPLFRGAARACLVNGSAKTRARLATSGIEFVSVTWNGR